MATPIYDPLGISFPTFGYTNEAVTYPNNGDVYLFVEDDSNMNWTYPAFDTTTKPPNNVGNDRYYLVFTDRDGGATSFAFGPPDATNNDVTFQGITITTTLRDLVKSELWTLSVGETTLTYATKYANATKINSIFGSALYNKFNVEWMVVRNYGNDSGILTAVDSSDWENMTNLK